AGRIRAEGWSAWELRPDGQAQVGIAAALYALVAPEPWTMIPINAILHAASGVLLAGILLCFNQRWKLAFLAILPLVLFPSAATWYSQLGKDGFSIAGYLASILGWLFLGGFTTKPSTKKLVAGLALILIGAGLVWIVRLYAVEMLWVLSGPAAALVTVVLVVNVARRRLAKKWALSGTAISWLAFLAIGAFAAGGYVAEPYPISIDLRETEGQTYAGEEQASVAASNSQVSDGEEQPLEAASNSQISDGEEQPLGAGGGRANDESRPQGSGTVRWSRANWMPNAIDERLYSLAVTRKGFTTMFPNAASNVDREIIFNAAEDVFEYLPRAGAIALIYPPPADWLGEGSLPQNTLMRRIAGLEMIWVYFALLMLPYALWRWRMRIELWLFLPFSFGMLIAHALVVANLGTLYRMRYPYLMSLVSLALFAGLIAVSEIRSGRSTKSMLEAET
ncbi:MAG: hypothetical protein ACE5M4_08620, partial [Anaerolineales bacterium]